MPRQFAIAVLGAILLPAPATAQPSARFTASFVNSAMERLDHKVTYDGSYRSIAYPNGDVPDYVGVCTDLVIRAYRGIGFDLQQAVHEDMRASFDAYPAIWGLTAPDPNIDHRRVPNLQVFFERHGLVKARTRAARDYRAGDIVTWMLPSNQPHIGIVALERTPDAARPLIIHNIGSGPKLDDILFEFEITGHYRFEAGD
jgi:uncharacterized protein YijF (DUF1287 family)